MTESAMRRVEPDRALRERIARTLLQQAGSGLATDARIAGLAQSSALAHELRELLPKSWARAAVLVPLVDRPGGLTVLFTQRSAELTNHPGQVSFPGGRIEARDAGPWEAAVREAQEEIGLPPDHVRRVGYLHDHLVISGFVVTPVVAYVTPGFEFRLDRTEVDGTFEAPLEFLLDRANYFQTTRRIGGRSFPTWDIAWQEHRIWGATAGMLVSFAELVAGA
ncbi:MAG TPA: CoA pyrophosphatase [Burkholderiales bacterium]|nr:CoA pyrophosphatase [Burkholderiales bacterium]